MRKEKFLVLDVETAGGFDAPKVYDIGLAITDRDGKIYAAKSFLIKEVFNNEKLMNTAHYREKLPIYFNELKRGMHQVVPFMYAREVIHNLLRRFKVKRIMAYNLAFDLNALNKTIYWLTDGFITEFISKEFSELKYDCIWGMACEVLYTQQGYQRTAIEQGWVTEAGNIQTKAEHGYRFITKQYDFIEAHTGLKDVIIEIQIMAKCFRQRKRMTRGIIPHPWKIPNKKQ